MKQKENNPCYHCNDRHASCHGSCEHYKAWSTAHIEAVRKIRTALEAENTFHSYNVESGERIKRMRKGKRK